MSDGATAEAVAALLSALAETASLLEAGDPQGAAAAMARVEGRCPSLSAGGLNADEVAEARRLLERCRDAGGRLHRRVSEELAQNGSARRAHNAYGG
jgi:hypothetical protein